MTVTAVTDLEQAHLVTSNEKPGGNVTGTTDMVPIEKQIGLLLTIVPDAKTIGIMYNNDEANSKIQADLAEKELKKAGVKVKVLTANSTNDVQQVTKSLAKDVDGIYIPTDNTFASAASVVGEVAKRNKKHLSLLAQLIESQRRRSSNSRDRLRKLGQTNGDRGSKNLRRQEAK